MMQLFPDIHHTSPHMGARKTESKNVNALKSFVLEFDESYWSKNAR